MTTLPAAVVQRLIVDVLYAQVQRLRNRLDCGRNPHRPASRKEDGRRQEIARREQSARTIQAMKPTGDVSAEIAALLAAWTSGHTEAIAQLETLDSRVEGLAAWDVVRACKMLLGGNR